MYRNPGEGKETLTGRSRKARRAGAERKEEGHKEANVRGKRQGKSGF